MDPFLYSLFVLFAGFFMFFQKRPFSLASLMYVGVLLYGMPLFFGETEFVTSYLQSMTYLEPLNETLYYSHIIILLFSVLISIKINHTSTKPLVFSDFLSLKVLVVFQVIYTCMFLIDVGPGPILGRDKDYLVANASVFYFFASYSSIILLNWLILKREISNWPYAVFPSLFLLIDLYVGYRTNFFLGICSFIISYGFHFKEIRFGQRLLLVVGAFSFAMFAFIYKAIVYSIEVGGIDNLQFITPTTFKGSEPFIVMGSFNEIINQNISVPAEFNFSLLFQYIPLGEAILGVEKFSFNSLLQNQLFPETEWGIASTGLGSLYISGGFWAIILYGLFLFFLSYVIYKQKSAMIAALLISFSPYVFFYFYRNDWFHGIGVFKLMIFSLIPYFAFCFSRESLEIFRKILRGESVWGVQ